MHGWNDEEVDWKGIDDAYNIIGDTCRRYARLGGQVKEKFGTIRFYAQFGNLSLHGLIYPGYHYIRFPDWLYKLDTKVISPCLRFFLERIFRWWQAKVYNYAYQKALKKYPHLYEEITCCADYIELIKGCKQKLSFLRTINKVLNISNYY